MSKISISKDTVCIEITGWDQIWSFKGSLTIPVAAIRQVSAYDGKLKPPLWRLPGTAIPKVIIAGTYYGEGRKEFWDTHFTQGTIVFDLQNAEYTRIVVDVADSEAVLSQLKLVLTNAPLP